MDQLQDRADVPIWNAIEASNYKQALKLVDKRLSKKPTEYLEALKVYIRSFSGNVVEKTAVLISLEEIAQQKKPLLDLAVIELYENALEQILDSTDDWARIIGEIRWQCVKAVPKSEDIGLKCFKACLHKKDLDHARQIANSLEKNFLKKREYIFWNLSAMFLFSISPKYPSNQTKLWGSLAFAQISKMAVATKEIKGNDQPPLRSIQTPQELLLLHLITKTCGKRAQEVEYLEDPQLGPESSVSKGEWEIWRMRLRMMQEDRRWDDLFSVTGKLLERSRTKNESGQIQEAHLADWIIWETHIKSAVELGNCRYVSKVRDEVEAHLDPASGIDKSWRRNASLAWVKLAFEGAVESTAVTGESTKVDTVAKYLAVYGDAATAYNDLRPFVERLNAKEREVLLGRLHSASSDLSSAKSITKAANNFKLKYLLSCSLPETERYLSPKVEAQIGVYKCIVCSKPCGRFCENCLLVLAKDSLHSYKTALDDKGEITKHLLTTDRHPADDLCILSATCLIKLGLVDVGQRTNSLTSSRSRYFMQAAALLEKAWPHSKPNFQISLMLVRLYTFLGCGSLAMRAYQRLALKNIQLDTLSYVLFDRLSTFHPRPFTSHCGEPASEKSPLLHLKRHQKVYKDAYEQISKNIWLSFKHGSYNSIYNIQKIEEELSRGLGAAMSVIESRRASRFSDPGSSMTAVSHGYNLLAANIEAIGTMSADNLDYRSFPCYESTLGTPFEELSRIAPAPSSYRYRSHLVAEKLFIIISPSAPSGEQETLRGWLKQHIETSNQDPSKEVGKDNDVMTQPEILAWQTYHVMALIVNEAWNQEQWLDSDFSNRLRANNKELSDVLDRILTLVENMEMLVPAYFDTLHALHIAYEVGKAVVTFINYVEHQGKLVHEAQAQFSADIAATAKYILGAVEKQCIAIRKGMDEGWIDKVLECVSSDGSLLDDDNFMEEWAGEVVESWRESVAGLSYLKAS